jgi:hypothetical protein
MFIVCDIFPGRNEDIVWKRDSPLAIIRVSSPF